MKKRIRAMKKGIRGLSLPIKLGIGVVLILVVAVIGTVLLGGGDDESGDSAGQDTTGVSQVGDHPRAKKRRRARESTKENAPVGGTIDVARGKGPFAIAQATGSLKRASGSVGVRVSAAPKQEAAVSWTFACGAGSKTDSGQYQVTPPNTRVIHLPVNNARTCNLSANAQLSKRGRVKVALLREG
ncbi:MAG: hypothetical protein M3296_02525 [Actinomycetota bacterium]|nr:hypothetical protein [Actinomycetota bacterium]